MIYLLLCVLSSVVFMQILRCGQGKGVNTLAAVAVNYVIAFLFSAGFMLLRGEATSRELAFHAAAVGVVNGVLFFAHVPFVLGSFSIAGVGVTTALTRAGIVIPALVAWYAWGEAMTVARWLALGLVPPAMLLLRPSNGNGHKLTARADATLVMCLLVAGVILTIHKYAEVHFDSGGNEVYKVALFGAAALSSVGYVLVRRIPCARRDVGVGVALGAANAATLLFVMFGLAVVPATVFYPTTGCLTLCLNVIAAYWLWREALVKRQAWGIAVAVAILVLANV